MTAYILSAEAWAPKYAPASRNTHPQSSTLPVHILNAFLVSAQEVLRTETGGPVHRLGVALTAPESVSAEVISAVWLAGKLRGAVSLGMPLSTARSVAAVMLDRRPAELTELSWSAVAELANLTAGGALSLLERVGLHAELTPPFLLMGKPSELSTSGLPCFAARLNTVCGPVSLFVAYGVTP